MNLREGYAATGFASLEWSEQRERAIDRVAAAGKAPRLGLDLWRARYLLEARSYQDAQKALILVFLGRYKSEQPAIAEKCVEEALSEFMGPACNSCNGARELILGDLRVECTGCKGSGLKVYSNLERCSRMRLSMGRVRLLEGKLYWLACELGSLDRAVNSIMAVELER